MTKTEYAEYLRSEHWKRLRGEALREHPECSRCGIPREMARDFYDQDLNVHHKRYNLWHETLSDLEALCRRCHDIETNGTTRLLQHPRYPAPELRQVISEPPCEVIVYRAGPGQIVIRQAAGLADPEDSRVDVQANALPRLIWALTVLERSRAR